MITTSSHSVVCILIIIIFTHFRTIQFENHVFLRTPANHCALQLISFVQQFVCDHLTRSYSVISILTSPLIAGGWCHRCRPLCRQLLRLKKHLCLASYLVTTLRNIAIRSLVRKSSSKACVPFLWCDCSHCTSLLLLLTWKTTKTNSCKKSRILCFQE